MTQGDSVNGMEGQPHPPAPLSVPQHLVWETGLVSRHMLTWPSSHTVFQMSRGCGHRTVPGPTTQKFLGVVKPSQLRNCPGPACRVGGAWSVRPLPSSSPQCLALLGSPGWPLCGGPAEPTHPWALASSSSAHPHQVSTSGLVLPGFLQVCSRVLPLP